MSNLDESEVQIGEGQNKTDSQIKTGSALATFNAEADSVETDQAGTDSFHQSKNGEERGSNILRVGIDAQTKEKVLVKIANFLKDADGNPQTGEEFLQKADEFELELLLDHLKKLGLAQAAYELADRVGIKMAKTKVVNSEGSPGIQYEFLEGAKDKGFGGSSIEYSNQPEELKDQEAQLAMQAFFKIMTRNNGDGGQILQAQSGEIFFSDVEIIENPAEVSKPQQILFEIFQQGSAHDIYFATNPENLQHQLNGINSPAFLEMAKKVLKLPEENVEEILMKNQNEQFRESAKKTAKILLQRAKMTLDVFTVLGRFPAETIKVTNPKDRNTRQPIYSEEDVRLARVTLIQEVKKL